MNRFCRSVGPSVAFTALALLSVAGIASGSEPQPITRATAQPILIPFTANAEPGAVDRAPANPFQTRFPGCLPTVNCQENNLTPAAAGRASCTNAPTPFIVADNFRLPGTGAQNINSICFVKRLERAGIYPPVSSGWRT